MRKGWDLLSDAYRDRLARAGITEQDYNAGVPLHGARGHVSAATESFARQSRTFAAEYSKYTPATRERVLSYVRSMGRAKGVAYMQEAREMARRYSIGEVREASQMWLARNKNYPDWMYYYHGVFAY